MKKGFSSGFGPGLDSMSPARSWRSASHAAGWHDWLPKKLGPGPPERQDKRWIQFAQSLLTVAQQPRAGCIRLVLYHMVTQCIQKNIDKLQIVQNTALRIATG